MILTTSTEALDLFGETFETAIQEGMITGFKILWDGIIQTIMNYPLISLIVLFLWLYPTIQKRMNK